MLFALSSKNRTEIAIMCSVVLYGLTTRCQYNCNTVVPLVQAVNIHSLTISLFSST